MITQAHSHRLELNIYFGKLLCFFHADETITYKCFGCQATIDRTENLESQTARLPCDVVLDLGN